MRSCIHRRVWASAQFGRGWGGGLRWEPKVDTETIFCRFSLWVLCNSNHFSCGGTVLGKCSVRQLGDATSWVSLGSLTAWPGRSWARRVHLGGEPSKHGQGVGKWDREGKETKEGSVDMHVTTGDNNWGLNPTGEFGETIEHTLATYRRGEGAGVFIVQLPSAVG